ncbi:MAG: DUF1489 domain-containing protein [Rhodospirillum sp.]|nr:DUF1489 domain-containing protein [Rhodospirillum sp.]MCF8488540.1 DUF1489 domain-containing protein [Rhodospirillum sp.]MCF8499136.1 DUF1489 domain-containing protein [Rhodospirillum sp.]
MSVGSETVVGLAQWQALRLETAGELIHPTRMMPKRAAEILGGGSIYWVFLKAIRVRQRILDLRAEEDADGRAFCAIVLDPALIEVENWPHRAFQGWRYLPVAKAPPDRGPVGSIDPAMPEEMARDLRDLGFL